MRLLANIRYAIGKGFRFRAAVKWALWMREMDKPSTITKRR